MNAMMAVLCAPGIYLSTHLTNHNPAHEKNILLIPLICMSMLMCRVAQAQEAAPIIDKITLYI